MSVLKIKDANNNWQSIPAIKGADGRDGYVQYTAGTGIDITNNVISNTQTSAEWGNITGDIEDQTDLGTALAGKADVGDIPDLTGYVKNTDYATSSTGGVLKIDQNYGLRVSSGTLIGYGVNYADYQSALNQLVIDKGTLENVITGKGLDHAVKSMDDTVVDIKAMTQAEYDVLTPAEQSTGTYLITDGNDSSFIDELPIGSVIEYAGSTVPDGWVLDDPSVIAASTATSQTLGDNTTDTIPMTGGLVLGDKLTLHNDGYVLIGDNVSYIKAYGSIIYSTISGTDQRHHILIFRNSTNMGSLARRLVGNWDSINIQPVIMAVSPGDKIYLKSRAQDGPGATIYNATLTVEVIK